MNKHNKPQGTPRIGSSAVSGCGPRITDENLRRCQRRQWERNKQRLWCVIGNILTLGLGENLWYGDRLDRKVNTVTASRLLGKRDVNISDSVSSSLVPDQIADTRNVIKRENGGRRK